MVVSVYQKKKTEVHFTRHMYIHTRCNWPE